MQGIWEGSFEYPADWRKDSKAAKSKSRFFSADDDGTEGSTARPLPALASSSVAKANTSSSAVQRAGSLPPDAACPIKGNVSAQGARIYHVPGSRSYHATVIVEGDGERWFCSTADAEKAGWRAAK